MASVVVRDDVRVMFLRTKDEVAEIQAGWARLEQLVGTRGRKFYGAFSLEAHEYWVCTELKNGDDVAALGLEAGVLPGGRYLRERLRGEPPAVYERIGPMFQAMAHANTPDMSRPSIEFYRQRDAIDLLLPIGA